MPTKEDKYKSALRELVDAILESGVAADIEAGCDGHGPIVEAMIVLGESFKVANKMIWGEDAVDF